MLPKKKLTKAEAKALLEQAREHLSKGKLDEAERLASRVQVELANGWGLFEDSPHRVLRDIRRERTKRNRAEADALLAQARKDFEAGRIAEAKSKALRAERLHGPYSIWDFGDRPEKLLNEIQVAEARIRMRERIQQNQKKEDAIVDKPQESRPIEEPMVARAKNLLKLAREKVRAGDFATAEKLAEHVEKLGVNLAGSAETPQTIRRDIQLAKGSVPQPPAPGTTANAQPPEDANKLKARQLLAEARQHKDKLELLEARRKALEAQQLNVRYEPGELRPEQLLIDLAGLATKRIDVLVRRADDLVAMSAVEPARKQEAEQLLMEAKELGLGFSLDVQPVEMKLAWLRNQPTGQGTAVASSPKPAVSDTQQARGLDLLNKARMELRRGETSVARRLAEEAFRGPYGVQAQAEDLLRSIDAEEFNQQRNTANRFFDAFHSAYIRGDIMQAVTIGKSIDTKLLDSARLARFNEIMRTAEMQQALSAQNQPIRPASGATAVASDEPKSKGMTLADQVAALQKIQFQKLREEGLQAQREAIDRFRRGDTEEALRLLESYLEALNDADLDSSQIALLRRPIDARLDLFKKMKVQRELASMRQNERTTFEAMRSRQARAEELKKRTVKELMDDYNRLIDEGKYREAEMKALAALEMDPDNVAAAAGVKIARVQGNLVSYNKNKLAKEKYFVEVLNDAEKAPPVLTTDNPVSFPDDWADRIKRSKSWKDGITIGGLKSPKELEIERRLSEPISFNFKNVSLGEAIEDLNNLTGINVVPDYAALEEEGISLDQPLSLSLSSSISLKSALNLLLGQAKLTYIIKDEVLKITTPRRARGKLVQKTYQVADLVVPVDNYTIAETANLNSVLERVSRQNSMMNATGITPYTGPRSLPGGVPTGSPGEGEYSPGMEGPFPGQVHGQPQSSQAGRKPGQTLEDVLIKLITNTIDPHSWSQMGGPGTIDYFPLGMALVINQTPDIQEQVAELLAALRRLQDVEVAIEVRFISISESFYEPDRCRLYAGNPARHDEIRAANHLGRVQAAGIHQRLFAVEFRGGNHAGWNRSQPWSAGIHGGFGYPHQTDKLRSGGAAFRRIPDCSGC
ncbi:MAG: hypothetical protein KatS3mg105_1943 [Gemmatales bacterium]|nr:MAG: hypothetical protein KatS3mg105_1943 [Gemmatales bacterium]